MITKKIIEKIEGEAELFFEKKDEKIDFVTISFEHFRGFSDILKNKPALDALVFTPRICGICGHSHLYATTRALEDAYKNSSEDIKISNKAYQTREITLILEIIQNHLKWIYFVVLEEINKLQNTNFDSILKGAYGARLISKIIAIFSGQYPHSSYMLPGGITSDFTYVDITKALGILDELIIFFQKEVIGVSIEKFLEIGSCKDFNDIKSDFAFIEKSLIKLQMHKKGFGYDRFLVLGEHSFSTTAKIKKTIKQNAKIEKVSINEAYSPHKKSFALNALYKDEFIEVGPLARAMANNEPIIKNIHRKYKDSTYSRVMSRMYEMIKLTKKVKHLIQEISIEEASYIKPKDISKITAKGIGVVEAPRGVLIHKVDIIQGKINSYEIITPTQFNLSSGDKTMLSASQKAMLGVDEKEAGFIFRSFDVCSVCTTH